MAVERGGALRVLIVGLLRYDSGKTSFALELIEAMRELGVSPAVFKPIGAHNAWWQRDTIEYSVELGLLVGHDAYLLAEAAGMLDAIETVSPIDILTAPIDPSRMVSLRSYLDAMSGLADTAVMARFSVPGEGATHLLIRDNYSRAILDSQIQVDRIAEAIRKKGGRVAEATRSFLLRLLYTPALYEEAIASAYTRLSERSPVIIIESFSNAAYPSPTALAGEGYVAAVAPGKITVYSMERYRRAAMFLENIASPLYLETHRVVEIAGTPIATYDWSRKPTKPYSEAAAKLRDLVLG